MAVRTYKTRRGGYGTLYRFGAMAARAAVGYGKRKAYDYLTGASKKKQTQSGQGVTSQYNSTTVYRKRRVSRRKRARFVKRFKLHQAMTMKSFGLRSVTLNDRWSAESSVGLDQVARTAVALYGGTSTSGRGFSDVGSLFSGVANTTAEEMTTTTDLHFSSAVLDVTVTNTAAYPSEIDVYEIWVWRGQATTASQDIIAAFDDAATQQTTLTGYSQPDISMRGVTPFEMPNFFKAYGARIIKKKKYLISAGNAFTYQLRDPRNHKVNRTMVSETSSWVVPGMTKCLVIQSKIIPGYPDTTAKVNVGATRTYRWKNMENNGIAQGYAFA